jgi:Tfp pilus assembly protein PilO
MNGEDLIELLCGNFFGMSSVTVVEVPLDLKIKLLDNVVILSFGFRPPLSDEARESWIRERLGTEFREELMLYSNTIMNLETARSELVRLERQQELLILQQQSTSTSTQPGN